MKIMFRVFSKKEGVMYEDVGVHPSIIEAHWYDPDNGYKKGDPGCMTVCTNDMCDNYILMQYSNCLDSTGKRICKDDIVEYAYECGAGRLSWTRPIIQDDDGRFCMGGNQIEENPHMTISGAFAQHVRIIGNIHSNPEIVKG